MSDGPDSFFPFLLRARVTATYLPDATTTNELQTMAATGSRIALTVHPLMRQWYALDATQAGWTLQSPKGPIAQIQCQGDRIVGAEFLMEHAAQALVLRRQGTPPKELADRASMLAALQPTRTRFAEQLAETVRLTERTNERSEHRAVWDTAVGCSVVATLDGDRVRSIAWTLTDDGATDGQTPVVTTSVVPSAALMTPPATAPSIAAPSTAPAFSPFSSPPFEDAVPAPTQSGCTPARVASEETSTVVAHADRSPSASTLSPPSEASSWSARDASTSSGAWGPSTVVGPPRAPSSRAVESLRSIPSRSVELPRAASSRSVELPRATPSSRAVERSSPASAAASPAAWPATPPTPPAEATTVSPMSRDDKVELERALARMKAGGQRGSTPFEIVNSATTSPVMVPGETADQGWARLTALGVHIEGKPAPVPVVGPGIGFALLAFAFVISVFASGGFFSILLGGMAAFGGVKLLGAIRKGSGVVVISGTGGVIVVQQESMNDTAHLAEHVTQRELGAVIDAKGWRGCFRLASVNGSIPHAYLIYGPPMMQAPSQLTAFPPDVWHEPTSRRVEVSEQDFHAFRRFLGSWSHYAAEADRLIDLDEEEDDDGMTWG